jgi:hypothetical protein
MNQKITTTLRMAQATLAILNRHESAWKTLSGFAEGVNELKSLVSQIAGLLQVQSNRTAGASAQKAQALQALVDSGYELAAATHAGAVAQDNQELAARVDYSRSGVARGVENRVITRGQDILDAATENVKWLAPYGVTTAKLNAFRKTLESYQVLVGKPREVGATASAATVRLGQLKKQLNTLLRQRLDKLIVQFKESHPEFYVEYSEARWLIRTSRTRSTAASADASGVQILPAAIEPEKKAA